MCSFADSKFNAIPDHEKAAHDDLKIPLTKPELDALVGIECVQELESAFGLENYDEILIRRC